MSSSLLFLGLINRAKKLQIGEETCGIAARNHKIALLLLASDAGRNSFSRGNYYLNSYNTQILILPYTKDELGAIVGHGTPGMIAITDVGMALAFVNKLAAEHMGEYDAVKSVLEQKFTRKRQKKGRGRINKS